MHPNRELGSVASQGPVDLLDPVAIGSLSVNRAPGGVGLDRPALGKSLPVQLTDSVGQRDRLRSFSLRKSFMSLVPESVGALDHPDRTERNYDSRSEPEAVEEDAEQRSRNKDRRDPGYCNQRPDPTGHDLLDKCPSTSKCSRHGATLAADQVGAYIASAIATTWLTELAIFSFISGVTPTLTVDADTREDLNISPLGPIRCRTQMVDASLIKRISTSLAAHQSALGSAEELLQATLDLSGSPGGAIYLLSLADGRYEPICSAGHPDAVHPWPTIGSEAFTPRHQSSSITAAIPSSRFLDSSHQGVAVLAFRKSTCLGALVLDNLNWDQSSDVSKLALESTAALLVPVFHRRFTSELLDSLQSPLDFRKSEPEFYEDVGELIGLSAGMEFSAIRELEEDGSLACLGFWDHGRENKSSRFDIEDPASLPPFLRATKGKTAAVADVADEPEMRVFLDEAGLESVPELRGDSSAGRSRGLRCSQRRRSLRIRLHGYRTRRVRKHRQWTGRRHHQLPLLP